MKSFFSPQSLKVQFIMAVKAWQQDHETLGYSASAARKQRQMNAGTRLAFFFSSFYLVWVFSSWDSATISRVNLLSSI